MSYFDIILERRSVRAYADKPVEEKKLMQVMGAGLHSASAMNRQPYKVFVVEDPALRQQIVRAQHRINFWMSEAPVIMVITVKSPGQSDWQGLPDRYLDAGIMVANMMLAATALGLGSCACAAFDDAKVIEALTLPKSLQPIICLPIGYPRIRRKNVFDFVKGYEKIVHQLTHYKTRTIKDIFVRK